jgi:ATP-binding cassette subfamily F protein 3
MADGKELRQLVSSHFGNIDPIVIEYVQSYFLDKDVLYHLKAYGPDELLNDIGPLLLDASEDAKSQQALEKMAKVLREYCDKHKIQAPEYGTDANGSDPRPLTLDNPVSLSDVKSGDASTASATLAYLQPHTFTHTFKSQVDATKLAKAHLKLKKKQEKRLAEDSAMYNKLALKEELAYQKEREERASKLLAGMDPLELYKQAKGKTKDVKVENFDVSIGGRSILKSATLQLSTGRRYGLIGRNGIGKSTLLRAVAFRDINVPLHVSVLYVEQEIHGDETPALQAVLE